MKKSVLKWLAALGGASLGVAIAHPRLARSADHLDAPATTADPTADINDVYTWMDGGNAIFAMTVFPQATTGAKFSDGILYVFHTSSMASYGATAQNLDIICSFDTAQKISCWAGDEYATGNASAQIVQSKSTKMKVYAGLRKDPFFFNLDGFKTVTYLVADAGLQPADFNEAGCPQLSSPQAGGLAAQLAQQPDGGSPPVDFFKDLKTLAIVISMDKALVTKGGPIVAVWGSTNKKS